ncbi:MAG TPA: hypothetical protein VL093_05455 [Flavipsychrobacter sp.]|nr:hypothetical protein [Flavipsychrobacter sp.]
MSTVGGSKIRRQKRIGIRLTKRRYRDCHNRQAAPLREDLRRDCNVTVISDNRQVPSAHQ